MQNGTESTELTESTDICTTATAHWGVKWAINNTQPTEADSIWRKIWDFARALKAIPILTHAKECELTQYIHAWHNNLPSFIKHWHYEDTEEEFKRAWEKVEYAAGDGPIEHVFAIALHSTPPACADRFGGENIKLLISLCCELQRLSGDRPFFLSCRIAAKLLNVAHTNTARWLRILVREKVLKIVIPGSPKTNKDSRYKYLPRD
jgi:hypothetical protein